MERALRRAQSSASHGRKRWVIVTGMAAAVACAWTRSRSLVGTDRQRTYEWMEWAPPGTSVLQKTLDAHFPHAVPGGAVVPALRKHLTGMGVVPGMTLFGESVCADEINNQKEDLTNHLIRYWGNVFPLGGIGGAPFVGKSGFGAFSGHVPDNGHIFILFGPHVGISPDGEVGKFHRIGQGKKSTACGALIGGYNMLVAGGGIPDDDRDDLEEKWLCNKLKPHIEEISKAPNTVAALTHKAYEIIEEQVMRIVSTKFGTGKLVLLGGIQINMPDPYHDHFQPLHFSVHSQGKEPIDLLDTAFLPPF